MEESGQLILPNEDDAIAMFEATIELLTAGSYEHYEISNFARLVSGRVITRTTGGVATISVLVPVRTLFYVNRPRAGGG